MVQPRREWPSVPPSTRFPVDVDPPAGFDPDDLSTWPDGPGRYEFVDGRLLYMPPCGDAQGGTVVDVTVVLGVWQRQHAEFFVGGSEIGVMFDADRRGIDAAVWRKSALGERTGGFIRVPPILAVEVAGQDDREPYLRQKAAWYLAHGVEIVWLVLPETREVVTLTGEHEARYSVGDTLAAHKALPDLAPAVADFFRQL